MRTTTNPISFFETFRNLITDLLNYTSVIAAADAVFGASAGGDVFPECTKISLTRLVLGGDELSEVRSIGMQS